jgi:hypothetical protein
MDSQSRAPCKNGRQPTARGVVAESPAPIRNSVSVRPVVATCPNVGVFNCLSFQVGLGPNPDRGFAVAFLRALLITKQSRGQTFKTSGAICLFL